MLGLKSVVRSDVPGLTLVFDEVDAGIGGRVAEVVGRKLKAVAARQQVLCVTHLPQIAAFADQHLAVRKRVERGRTVTLVEPLGRATRGSRRSPACSEARRSRPPRASTPARCSSKTFVS